MINQMKILLAVMMFTAPMTADGLQKAGHALLAKSKQYHGAGRLKGVKLQIQEPRIQNPARYSTVTFGADGGFSLVRNRGAEVWFKAALL